MNIEQIAKQDKAQMLAMLIDHLEGCVREMLEEIGDFTAFLKVFSKNDRPKYFAVPINGQTDDNEILKIAIDMLKNQRFEYAIFSLVVPVLDKKGKEAKAVKSVVVLPSKMAGNFYTIYKTKGLFKKQPVYLETICTDIIPDIFNM